MKIYLAGPMRGIPHFNHPAFHRWTAYLRARGHEVFSPAEHDAVAFGDIATDNPTGDETKAKGFSRRAALAADMAWICANGEAIALMPGWPLSSGACAEKSLGIALGLEIIYLARRTECSANHLATIPSTVRHCPPRHRMVARRRGTWHNQHVGR